MTLEKLHKQMGMSAFFQGYGNKLTGRQDMFCFNHANLISIITTSSINVDAIEMKYTSNNIKSGVSCQKGPICHASWRVGPFWQDTLEISMSYS